MRIIIDGDPKFAAQALAVARDNHAVVNDMRPGQGVGFWSSSHPEVSYFLRKNARGVSVSIQTKSEAPQ